MRAYARTSAQADDENYKAISPYLKFYREKNERVINTIAIHKRRENKRKMCSGKYMNTHQRTTDRPTEPTN